MTKCICKTKKSVRCKNNAIEGSEFCHVHTNCAESVVKSETRRKVLKKKTSAPAKDKSAKRPKDTKSKVKKDTKSKVKKDTKSKVKREVDEKSHEDKPKKEDAKNKVKKDEKSKPKEEKEMPRIIIAQKQRAKPYPVVEGFKVYPIHSRGKGEWKKMSPFFIGPVEFIDSEGMEKSR